MIRFVAQMMLSLSLIQLFPVELAQVEQNAFSGALPPSSGYEIVENLLGGLPVAEAAGPRKKDPASLGVLTTAGSAIVVDAQSGETLYEKQADALRSVGSITKLLSAAVFLERSSDLDALVSLEESDLRNGGRDHLRLNDQVRVRDLLKASLVGSDNPATVALSRLYPDGAEAFILRMNARAKEIGMTQARFVDSTGLDPRNVTTAREVALLLRVVLEDPFIRETTQQAEVSFTSASGMAYRIPTTNLLLGSYLNRPPYAIAGGKTGFLPSAGYCVGIRVQDEKAHALFTVVLGSATLETRFQEAKALSQWAFDSYLWPDELGS